MIDYEATGRAPSRAVGRRFDGYKLSKLYKTSVDTHRRTSQGSPGPNVENESN
jgi:hypothetical protein